MLWTEKEASVQARVFCTLIHACVCSWQPEEQKEEKPAWSVLRDDFMMGSSMKDWDKESDHEERHKEPEGAEDFNSDSD